jgi:hypothetical protein
VADLPWGAYRGFGFGRSRKNSKNSGLNFIGTRRGVTKSGTIPKQAGLTVPNHPGDMPEGTLRAILKQAGIEPDEFLKK